MLKSQNYKTMKKGVISAIAVLLFVFGSLFTINAATLTVTKIADTNDNVCDADCSLREAIFAASSGDTIEFASPLFDSAQIISLSVELYVNKTLTINGKGANLTKISGNNANRVLNNDSDLTLNGLTVMNASVVGGANGAGAYNNGTLTVNNCIFSGNRSEGNTGTLKYGGAIYNHTGKTLTVSDSTFTANWVTTATRAEGGAIYNAGVATIARSTFSGNSVTGSNTMGAGGAIANHAFLVVEASTLFGNTVSNGVLGFNYGAAISNFSSNTENPVNYLINTTISGNRLPNSQSFGGGVYLNRGSLIISNVTITRNNAYGIYRDGGSISSVNNIVSGNNGGDLFGLSLGGSDYVGGDARLAPLAFNGGAVQTHALLPDSPAVNTGDNCVLAANGCGNNVFALTTDARGAGFPRQNGANVDMGAFERQPSVTILVTKTADTNDGACDADCSLREAIAAVGKGEDTIEFASPMFNSAQTVTLSLGQLDIGKTVSINGRNANLTTVSGNNLSRVFLVNPGGNLSLNGLTVTGGRTNSNGGGIVNNGAALIITNSGIVGNSVVGSANNNGGGIFNTNGGFLSITNSTISGNSGIGGNAGNVGNYGGGIYNDSTLIITNSTISGNSIGGGSIENQGGGVWDAGTTTIVNSTFTSNSATNTGAEGGGIYKLAGTILARNTIISGNNASTNANLRGTVNTGSNNFINGNAQLAPLDYYGGATRTHLPLTGSPLINAGNNCVLTTNGCGDGNSALTTDQRGGGFPRLFGATVDIGAVEVSRVVLSAASSGAGSLRQTIIDAAAGDTITFDQTFFNQPRTITGLYDINKNLTIIGPGANLLTIDANNSGRILGINGSATVNLSGIRFTRGRVVPPDSSGAGIVVFSFATLNASGIIVDNCSAPNGDGGGFFVDGTLNLTNSTVENNSANGSAGIYVEFSRTATLTRSIVRSNTATGNSGGIGNNGTLNFYDSTLNGNTAPSGGGLSNGGFANFANSTVSGNRATINKGAGIYNSAGNTLHLLNTTITNNQADGFAGAGIWNENFGNPTITVRARNTIIAGNISGNGNPVDYVGDLTNLGNNLINNANPGLAPLGNYGGATPTHALLPSSPAINAGDNCALTANNCGIAHSALPNDQRGSGAPRKIGANVDIGAFESSVTFDQTPLPNGNTSINYNQQLSAIRQTNLVENGFKRETLNLAPAVFEIVPVAGQGLPPGITLSPSGLLSGLPTFYGNYVFTVKATDTDGVAGVQQYSIYVFSPTSANVSIGGRVLTSGGNGLRNAEVILTDSNGNSRTEVSSSFGYFRFENIEAGRTYIIGIRSKKYQFIPQILNVSEDVAGLILTANEQ